VSARTIVIAAAAVAAGLAGCGETQQVVVYKQGKYQGKPDAKPYENETFANDKAKWEGAIKARNQYQNEYRRTGG
jgi:hypothetical protein